MVAKSAKVRSKPRARAKKPRFSENLQAFYKDPFFTYGIRPAVFARDNYTCQDCKIRIPPGSGNKRKHLTCDHLLYPDRDAPYQAYRDQPISHYQTLCNTCHKKKTAAERRARAMRS